VRAAVVPISRPTKVNTSCTERGRDGRMTRILEDALSAVPPGKAPHYKG
jgi:hypothetical protein